MRILILIHYTIHCTVHARCNQGAHIADMKQTWNISTRDMQPETNLEVLYPWFPLTKHRKHDDSHDRSDTYSWTKCGIQLIIPLTLLFMSDDACCSVIWSQEDVILPPDSTRGRCRTPLNNARKPLSVHCRVRQWWVPSLILLTAGFSCQLTDPPSMI